MIDTEQIVQPLHDIRSLFVTRALRMFAYGGLSVVLVLYLTSLGLSPGQVGILLTMTLLGDVALSLGITTSADRLGRRRMLMLGAAMMVLVSLVFSLSDQVVLLTVAATIGVLSPSDKDVGPFQAIEQAALAQSLTNDGRTAAFAWYNLCGTAAAACGALVAGLACTALVRAGYSGSAVYRPVVAAYGVVGVLLGLFFARLSPAVEATHLPAAAVGTRTWFGLHRSKKVVVRLSALFALDAFAGGLILQSLLAYWMTLRFEADPAMLGLIFFVANWLAAASALGAAWLARRFGLINTMVFTHLPSNVLLMLMPLMPSFSLAITVYLLRCCICQMDVPTRQSYTLAVVAPDERSAAGGITTVARSLGSALSPTLAGYCLADPQWINLPLYLAGGVKIVYDLCLYRAFVLHQPEAR